jgi:hypothetical protein
MDRIPIGEQPDDTDNVVRLPAPGPKDAADGDMSYEEAHECRADVWCGTGPAAAARHDGGLQ